MLILAASWSYDDQPGWEDESAACGSDQQSPIALNTAEVRPNSTLFYKSLIIICFFYFDNRLYPDISFLFNFTT